MSDKFNKYIERYNVSSFNNLLVDNDTKFQSKDEDTIFDNSGKYSTKSYKSVYRINGMAGYMCPNCFNVEHMCTKVDNDAEIIIFDRPADDDMYTEFDKIDLSVNYDVKTKCSICKYYKSHIILDENIADTIGILNLKGYHTIRSSEGHPGDDPYIVFDFKSSYSLNMRTDIEAYLESTLPLSWYIDRRHYVASYTFMSEDTLLRFPIKRIIPIYAHDLFTIKSDFWNKKEALRDILKWARCLPDLNQEG